MSISIIDLGSQYTMLIARRIRELGVYSEIFSPDIVIEKLTNSYGVILSGGPNSVYDEQVKINKNLFSLNKPILGICYGMQLMAYLEGGKVKEGKREYGRTKINIINESRLFKELPKEINVWMSHGDQVVQLPKGFKCTSKSDTVDIVSMEKDNLFGLQFHPEVTHTEYGNKILENFVFEICKEQKTWSPSSFIEKKVNEIKERVKDGKVILGLSGGVDSSVTCAILQKAIGDRAIPIFVDTGLLRKGEREEVKSLFKNVIIVSAQHEFLSALSGITDPEKKRKIIGEKFISVFERTSQKLSDKGEGIKFLAQGTLYPDRIESKSQVGPSATIKTHHNVGGLPEKMGLELIEPLKDLFKDEVREVGRELRLPDYIIERHPFPGPGLAVRIIGEVTQEKLNILREADDIFITEIKKAGVYNEIWQAFSVLLPVYSVGVMGDKRTYENVIALRAVTSRDGMTSAPYEFEWKILTEIGDKIVREVKGVNRVVYDISSKPPATIEWE